MIPNNLTVLFAHNINQTRIFTEKYKIDVMGTSQDGLDKYRNVIISSGIISSIKDQEERRKQAVWREREINNALKNGSHVCILCGDTDDLLFKQTLSSNSIQFIKSVHHILQIEVHRSEFSTFLDKYGTSFGIFSANKLFDSVICTTPKVHVSALLLQRDITVYKNHGYIIGYTLKKGDGMLILLVRPILVSPNHILSCLCCHCTEI